MLVALAGLLFGWAIGILWLSGIATTVTGPLSDLSPLFIGPPLLYVAWVLHRMYRGEYPTSSGAVFAVGIIGLSINTIGGLVLVLDQIGVNMGPAQTLLTFHRIGIAGSGLWLLGVSGLEVSARVFDRRIGFAGLVAGIGGTLGGIGLLLGGTADPLFGIGSLLQLVGTVVWSVWLGRRLLANQMRTSTETPTQQAPPA